jgi:hypothetical protein
MSRKEKTTLLQNISLAVVLVGFVTIAATIVSAL